MITAALVTAALGSPVFSALVAWMSGRGKSRAETAEKLVASAMVRMDRSDARVDKLEAKIEDVRVAIFPHQQWDVQAHRKALEVDPNFPPPPVLHI
ncbi:hypothetical protein [Nocardia sp. NPDC057440]|uniref:hypothetical protein n=1 Tax=Nocardia sp. NPDC057440 TaxID=3346134 RepID=UPI0036703BFF